MDVDGIECWTDGHKWFSTEHDDRCVEELLFGGYALYERRGDIGVHRGVAGQEGAWQWLNGESIEDIEGRLTVDGVTVA